MNHDLPMVLEMEFEDLLCCPECRGELGESSCKSCGRKYAIHGKQVRFIDEKHTTPDAKFHQETFNASSFTGRLFNFGKSLISSEFQPRNHLKAFLKDAHGVVVELGSGSRRLRNDIITVDLFPLKNVDIVADISRIPLRDGRVDHVILDSVIEHIADPAAVITEARRILKSGGRIFINSPFMHPYHGYPGHYQNFTADGLNHLLKDFVVCEIRPSFGPMTAWVNMTAETFAVIVAGERGAKYVIAKGCALLPIFWLKYLDVVFIRSSRSHRIANMLCATAVKP